MFRIYIKYPTFQKQRNQPETSTCVLEHRVNDATYHCDNRSKFIKVYLMKSLHSLNVYAKQQQCFHAIPVYY